MRTEWSSEVTGRYRSEAGSGLEEGDGVGREVSVGLESVMIVEEGEIQGRGAERYTGVVMMSAHWSAVI